MGEATKIDVVDTARRLLFRADDILTGPAGVEVWHTMERLVEEVEALRRPPPALCRFPTAPGRWLRRAILDMPCIEVDVFTGGMGGLLYMLPGDSVMRHVIDDGMWEVAP